jgi:hypothetical protein
LSLGVTFSAPDADRFTYERSELIAKIRVTLGGNAECKRQHACDRRHTRRENAADEFAAEAIEGVIAEATLITPTAAPAQTRAVPTRRCNLPLVTSRVTNWSGPSLGAPSFAERG